MVAGHRIHTEKLYKLISLYNIPLWQQRVLYYTIFLYRHVDQVTPLCSPFFILGKYNLERNYLFKHRH